MNQIKKFFKAMKWNNKKTNAVGIYYVLVALALFVGGLPSAIFLSFIIPGYFAFKTKEKALDYFNFIALLMTPFALVFMWSAINPLPQDLKSFGMNLSAVALFVGIPIISSTFYFVVFKWINSKLRKKK